MKIDVPHDMSLLAKFEKGVKPVNDEWISDLIEDFYSAQKGSAVRKRITEMVYVSRPHVAAMFVHVAETGSFLTAAGLNEFVNGLQDLFLRERDGLL